MSQESTIKRRLAAVAFADVASFTRLMAIDDVETIQRWRSLIDGVLRPLAEQQDAVSVTVIGDAVLLEFTSAVNAVGWAVDVQKKIKGLNNPSDPLALNLRIGINVDDVIIDNGTIQGDGINIASRIHQLAMPGQIAVTSNVRGYVINRLPLTFRDHGTPPLKNVSRPVHVFTVQWRESDADMPSFQPYLDWSTRPTMAVLPFREIGQFNTDHYFGDGITEDIITGLSRSRSFSVIARNSTLRYRDRTKDLRQIAYELDIRYVLDGSIRRHSRGLRINVELIDADSGRRVWAEQYDGANEELFEFQDRMVSSIVGSLEPRVHAVEVARARVQPTQNFDAYDCVMKALSQIYLFTDESYSIADESLERAMELDPYYAQAYAFAAWRLNFWVGEGKSQNPNEDRKRALELSQKAIALDPEDAFSLTVQGHLLAFLAGKPAEANELFEAALTLNQNSAFAWALSGLTRAYAGDADEALERLRNVWRLSPFDSLNFFFWIVAGIAEFVAGRYGESIAWLQKSKRANPRFLACLRILAAAQALAGQKDDASGTAGELLAAEPGFSVTHFLTWYPLQREADKENLRRGLIAAGLPE